MKIAGQNNYTYYQNKPKQPVFKGYFACPIKTLHFQACGNARQQPLFNELNAKCSKYFKIMVQVKGKIVKPEELKYKKFMLFYNTGIVKGALDDKWGQDNKIFLNATKLGVLNHRSADLAKDFAKLSGLESKFISSLLDGGNCFLGKRQNGEPFAIVGKDALSGSTKATVAGHLEVKPENLHVISQPNFHLDMAIRPLNYPYVLVGDPELTFELAKGQNKLNKGQVGYFEKSNEARAKNHIANNYADVEETVKQLEKNGFKAIRVPGLLGEDYLNFMNAVVHQEDDGSLIYITNKMHLGKQNFINFEEMFANYIKSKSPSIKEVIFIDGDGLVPNALALQNGGVHCMSKEEPAYKKWKLLLKKEENLFNKSLNDKARHKNTCG